MTPFDKLATHGRATFRRMARYEPGADASVVAWAPGIDIRGSKHRLRVEEDYQPANTYDVEAVWVVYIDPPCPAGLRQIRVRSQPRTFGPWLSADQVLMRDIDGCFFHLDLAATRGRKMGWGLPAPDGRRFAHVYGPGIKITEMQIQDTRTGHVYHTVDTGSILEPMAFDESGRVLACCMGGNVVVIDTRDASLIEEIKLDTISERALRVSLPVKERLVIHTEKAALYEFSIRYFDAPDDD